MSIKQYSGGIITKNPTAPTTSVAKGIWTLDQAQNYTKQGIWPRSPSAPTIGTATGSIGQASITFTAPSDTGSTAITSYTMTSSPGNISASGASSPIVVDGLVGGTPYTFTVKATNSAGTGGASAASNSVTPTSFAAGSTIFGSGTYSWVAPLGVTSVSVAAVGGGGGGHYTTGWSGGGGGLGYKNSYTVIPGTSYTVTAGFGGTNGVPSRRAAGAGGASFFVCTAVVRGGGGGAASVPNAGGTYTGDGGGNGGVGEYGGGGAGGYAGTGGRGGASACGAAAAGAGGGGGAGRGQGGGGGVGLYGQGCNGAGAAVTNGGGGGGSGGENGISSACGVGGRGGLYGGGGGGRGGSGTTHIGGSGAVRVVWPGTTRTFPSTNVCISNDTQGSITFATIGTYSWVAPAGVTSISLVAVGAGYMQGGTISGGGGALGYKNNITVTPGSSYTLHVPKRSSGQTAALTVGATTYSAATAPSQTGATALVNMDGGGSGGNGSVTSCGGGGGGAGGYSGNGGNGRGYSGSPSYTAGSGGGGGGGGAPPDYFRGGGGVGLYGQGANGAAGGGGGSGGASANYDCGPSMGGNYGGGGGAGNGFGSCDSGYVNRGNGAIRIVWPGTTRQFPSTNVNY